MSKQLSQALAQQVEHCYQIAEAKLSRTFPRPELGFAMRGQAAGAAHLQQNRLRFNLTLAADNQAEFLNQVVPHEVCHLLAWQLFGRVKPHGAEWQQLMVDVYGLVPLVRHQFDVTKVTSKRFDYRCGCQTHQLTVRRHNKIQRGQAEYHCRRCQGPLTLI